MRSLQHVNESYKHDEEQIDFYATVNEDGTPHITMITSLHIYDDDTLIWGEYSAGLSKKNQQERNKVGFLSVIDGRTTVSGIADWMESQKSGEKLDALNQIPEFRYNNVNGYSPAHILHKQELTEGVLDLDKYAEARERAQGALDKAGEGDDAQAIGVLTRQYLEATNGFKTLAYIDEKGYPRVIPLPQAVLTKGNRIIFDLMDEKDLLSLMEGKPVAVYAIEYPSMCAVLVSGLFAKKEIDGQEYGVVDVKRVYNPLLPVAGYIYPSQPIEAVTEFKDTVYEYNV